MKRPRLKWASTGSHYNPNAKNEGTSDFRYNAYWGGAPRYKATLQKVCGEGLPHIEMA
ncbi:MAG: hypothetical protein ACRBEQ_05385 [Hyphomonas sp.]